MNIKQEPYDNNSATEVNYTRQGLVQTYFSNVNVAATDFKEERSNAALVTRVDGIFNGSMVKQELHEEFAASVGTNVTRKSDDNNPFTEYVHSMYLSISPDNGNVTTLDTVASDTETASRAIVKSTKKIYGGCTCCVTGCFNNDKRDKDIRLYVFPKDPELRKKWIHNISSADESGRFNSESLPRWRRVCSAHFKGGKKTYMINIPTVFPQKMLKTSGTERAKPSTLLDFPTGDTETAYGDVVIDNGDVTSQPATHKCEMCENAFILGEDLSVHLRNHFAADPCVCENAFGQSRRKSGVDGTAQSEAKTMFYKCASCRKMCCRRYVLKSVCRLRDV